ncbi:glutathione S-transferase family protein [Paracoccus seriniphilus]|uniref:Glutathione S-transferase n=1 Tax=Paracoccus seriniphilus TaxID=184748 RepID=A0A239PWE6_9RHOB|nr:glutathione S-transferase family protein [Paracoccus seriniphilus]WCR13187.1 glutathione S-transferase family protein [Paracoccus seriniphilus]SNT74490.1 glutathione S-transferase [Paracoccus seriniphilus]
MIRLHHVPGSRSMRVLWLLEELGLTAELQNWSLVDGSLRSPDFRALSPAGRIPALEVDGRSIFESGAIVQYLTERENRLAPLPGDPERIDFLEWINFAETQANIIQALNIHHIFLRPETARSVALMKLDTKRLAVTARALNAHLEGKKSLLSSGFSAADCMMGFNIEALFRFLSEGDYPAVVAYRDAMMARPAYQRALARGGEDEIYTRDFYELPDA